MVSVCGGRMVSVVVVGWYQFCGRMVSVWW